MEREKRRRKGCKEREKKGRNGGKDAERKMEEKMEEWKISWMGGEEGENPPYLRQLP